MSAKPLVPGHRRLAHHGCQTAPDRHPVRAVRHLFFPQAERLLPQPECDSTDFREVELSRTGHIWSYTNACYKPPAPFVAQEPFVPYAIAAVQLEKEQMVVLGQVIEG